MVIFGFAAKYLNRPSKLLTYCNTAVYPFYIFHQTITVIIAYQIYQSSMSIAAKFFVLTLGTFIITAIIYEISKRIFFIRPLIGLK